jgi:hypothetical protein
MQSVFISGSITIKALPRKFAERLDKLIDGDLRVLVGDANGADRAMQQYLAESGADNVRVYSSGEETRNNLGDWPVERIHTTAKPGTRQFFTAKDVAMAFTADFGLMLWDGKSSGTLSNVAELTKRGKKSVVFVRPFNVFAVVDSPETFHDLLQVMTPDDRREIEGKINLPTSTQPSEQTELPL